ncbi:MAG: HNH endonuclease [Rhizobiaceae bacterium]|nr:HNH endonuclease [Rhizobiaceae bacterium]
MSLTAERLRELLSYDPTTGVFVWRVRRGPIAAGSVAGTPDGIGYIQIRIDRKHYRAQRLAWLYVTGEMPPHQVDHVNGERSDNRWANLRKATNAQNSANQRLKRCNTSGFKGVCWHAGGRAWMARIRANGKSHYLGLFGSREAAHAAYVAAADKLHGEFARTE